MNLKTGRVEKIMPEFLTTSGCSHHIEQIILTAKTQVHLLCPYLKLSKTLFERLIDANRRGVKIKIVHGKTELSPTEKQKLFSLENVEVYFFKNLHAKCYFNTNVMIITSMNMYEFSEKNNREMGILLNVERDAEAFTKAAQEAISIITNATRTEMVKIGVKESVGYCIRCLGEIKPNYLRPLCLNCYKQWEKYKNRHYAEKYCHCCGKETKTNLENPLCQPCASSGLVHAQNA